MATVAVLPDHRRERSNSVDDTKYGDADHLVLRAAPDMWQPPVYLLNHSRHNFKQRTTQADLEEIEDRADRAARRMYEGAG
jgi:hypothetical protein